MAAISSVTGNATSQLVNGVAAPGTGYDFADFLLGHPDTAAVNYGNADKYFRSGWFSVYGTDDWRLTTKFSLNLGLRWDYQTPTTERYGRLVNLQIGPGFTTASTVCAKRNAAISETTTSFKNSTINIRVVMPFAPGG